MRKPDFETTIRLLLSATVLFGSTMPPVQRHAHGGGDVDHTHRVSHVYERAGDRHHHLGHTNQNPEGRPETIKPASFAHLHVAGWLFQATLPVEDESEGDRNDKAIYLVRLIGDCLPTTSGSCGSYSIGASPPLPLIVAMVQPPTSWATTSLPATVLLCDTARHARSGVQLF